MGTYVCSDLSMNIECPECNGFGAHSMPGPVCSTCKGRMVIPATFWHYFTQLRHFAQDREDGYKDPLPSPMPVKNPFKALWIHRKLGKLRPCEHCGERLIDGKYGIPVIGPWAWKKRFWIECRVCLHRTISAFNTEKEAIDEWNHDAT